MQPRVAHYRQLADLIRTAIFAGEYPDGKLPSEPELQRQFRVTRPTAAQAIRILAGEGLVRTEHGRGSFLLPLVSYAVAVSTRSDGPLTLPWSAAAAKRAASSPAVSDLSWTERRRDSYWLTVWVLTVRSADPSRAAVVGLAAAMATVTAGLDPALSSVTAEPASRP